MIGYWALGWAFIGFGVSYGIAAGRAGTAAIAVIGGVGLLVLVRRARSNR